MSSSSVGVKGTSDEGGAMSLEEMASRLPSLEELRPRLAQLEGEVDMLSRSFEQLREAQERFLGNVATITLLKNVADESESLIPLTPSVYVDAKVKSSDGVLVDVGTGYYVHKDLTQADDYYSRKVRFLQEQLTKVASILSEKQQQFSAVQQAVQIRSMVHSS